MADHDSLLHPPQPSTQNQQQDGYHDAMQFLLLKVAQQDFKV